MRLPIARARSAARAKDSVQPLLARPPLLHQQVHPRDQPSVKIGAGALRTRTLTRQLEMCQSTVMERDAPSLSAARRGAFAMSQRLVTRQPMFPRTGMASHARWRSVPRRSAATQGTHAKHQIAAPSRLPMLSTQAQGSAGGPPARSQSAVASVLHAPLLHAEVTMPTRE